MAQSARVDSIEVLKTFRASLLKFAEAGRNGLSSAEFDIRRADQWLRQEQQSYWKGLIRKRTELVTRTKSDLNQKKLYKSPMGGQQSCIEEEKALAVAKNRLEEAEEKAAHVQRWIAKLEQEAILYKGQVQAIGRSLDMDVPNAVALLDRLLLSLEAYAAPSKTRSTPAADSAATRGTDDKAATSMSRGEPTPDATTKAEDASVQSDAQPPKTNGTQP